MLTLQAHHARDIIITCIATTSCSMHHYHMLTLQAHIFYTTRFITTNNAIFHTAKMSDREKGC